MFQAATAPNTHSVRDTILIEYAIRWLDWLSRDAGRHNTSATRKLACDYAIRRLSTLTLSGRAGQLVEDARWELAPLDSMGDTLDWNDPDDRDLAEQGLDEAARLLRGALRAMEQGQ